MLDLFGIVFSSVIMILVIFRAIQLDATTPWFRAPKTTDASGLKLRPNARSSPTAENAGRRR